MPNSTVPAAAPGLPAATIIAFPLFRPDVGPYAPNRARLAAATAALEVTWRFADLDDDDLDRATAATVELDRHGAIRLLRENAAALDTLDRAAAYLRAADERLQASIARALAVAEAVR